MTTISFGIGGYNSAIRRYIATVTSDKEKIDRLSEALRDVGFWTTVHRGDDDENASTMISIGEVFTQR